MHREQRHNEDAAPQAMPTKLRESALEIQMAMMMMMMMMMMMLMMKMMMMMMMMMVMVMMMMMMMRRRRRRRMRRRMRRRRRRIGQLHGSHVPRQGTAQALRTRIAKPGHEAMDFINSDDGFPP